LVKNSHSSLEMPILKSDRLHLKLGLRNITAHF
jgi:hypothetical protein